MYFWDLESSSQYSQQSTQKMLFTFLIFTVDIFPAKDLSLLIQKKTNEASTEILGDVLSCTKESTVGVGI